MGYVEPGERFTVKYGNGRELEAVALSFRQERELAKLEDKARELTKAYEIFDLFESALPIALPHMSEEEISALVDTLNLELLQSLLKSINEANSLSEDVEKKSEPPR